MNPSSVRRALSSLKGLAIGDAIGNAIGMASYAVPDQSMIHSWTDDTNMAISIFEVLRDHGRVDQAELARSFGTRYDPRRGYGPGMERLLVSLDSSNWRSLPRTLFPGGSFGNGAAMRTAPLGAYFARDPATARREARAAAEVTHAHPLAQQGAIAVAVAASLVAHRSAVSPPGILKLLTSWIEPGEMRVAFVRCVHLGLDASPQQVADQVGSGEDATALDTVPFAVWCALRNLEDFRAGVSEACSCAHDTDTVGAIVGGIIGARVGIVGLPSDWHQACEPLRI